jgi:hypothetical protein
LTRRPKIKIHLFEEEESRDDSYKPPRRGKMLVKDSPSTGSRPKRLIQTRTMSASTTPEVDPSKKRTRKQHSVPALKEESSQEGDRKPSAQKVPVSTPKKSTKKAALSQKGSKEPSA